jgi:hypothetical protein
MLFVLSMKQTTKEEKKNEIANGCVRQQDDDETSA